MSFKEDFCDGGLVQHRIARCTPALDLTGSLLYTVAIGSRKASGAPWRL
jgi:hypothetical protein